MGEPLSHEELIRGLRARDPDAAVELVRRFEPAFAAPSGSGWATTACLL
jgi:hypothetical protein